MKTQTWGHKRRWVFVERPERERDQAGQSLIYVVEDSSGARRGRLILKEFKPIGGVAASRRAARFRLEIEATRALHDLGASVVEIVDADALASPPYYVMPQYERGSVRSAIERGEFAGNLEGAAGFLRLLHSVIEGVHRNGRVHRDLKPENVLLNTIGEPVLCDLGLQRELDSPGATKTLEQLGSRHYMAPEVLSGPDRVSDWRAVDMYGFGKIAYEVAAGRVLPGVDCPVGEFDLGKTKGARPVWRLFNELVAGLVSHEIAVRTATWARAEGTLAQVIEESRNPVPDGTRDAATRLKGLLARSVNADHRARTAVDAQRNAEKIHALVRAILDAFRTTDQVASILELSSPHGRIAVDLGGGSPGQFMGLGIAFAKLPGHSRDGSSLPFLRARLRVGKSDAEDRLVVAWIDMLWDEQRRIRLEFFLCVTDGGNHLQATPRFESESMNWAGLDDSTLIPEAEIRATRLAARWVRWVLDQANTGEGDGAS